MKSLKMILVKLCIGLAVAGFVFAVKNSNEWSFKQNIVKAMESNEGIQGKCVLPSTGSDNSRNFICGEIEYVYPKLKKSCDEMKRRIGEIKSKVPKGECSEKFLSYLERSHLKSFQIYHGIYDGMLDITKKMANWVGLKKIVGDKEFDKSKAIISNYIENYNNFVRKVKQQGDLYSSDAMYFVSLRSEITNIGSQLKMVKEVLDPSAETLVKCFGIDSDLAIYIKFLTFCLNGFIEKNEKNKECLERDFGRPIAIKFGVPNVETPLAKTPLDYSVRDCVKRLNELVLKANVGVTAEKQDFDKYFKTPLVNPVAKSMGADASKLYDWSGFAKLGVDEYIRIMYERVKSKQKSLQLAVAEKCIPFLVSWECIKKNGVITQKVEKAFDPEGFEGLLKSVKDASEYLEDAEHFCKAVIDVINLEDVDVTKSTVKGDSNIPEKECDVKVKDGDFLISKYRTSFNKVRPCLFGNIEDLNEQKKKDIEEIYKKTDCLIGQIEDIHSNLKKSYETYKECFKKTFKKDIPKEVDTSFSVAEGYLVCWKVTLKIIKQDISRKFPFVAADSNFIFIKNKGVDCFVQ